MLNEPSYWHSNVMLAKLYVLSCCHANTALMVLIDLIAGMLTAH